ncbi:MAG: ABC transporter substrate-binding protein [Spirochaetales bacterium]|nr:ABC transporter substrate-binding protein [Spirochaetales bacterium]
MKKLLTVLLILAIAVSSGFAKGAPEAQQTDAVTYKDQVVIGFQSKTSSTNPTAQTSVAHRIFFNLTHDTLVDYNESSQEIVPGLATEWKSSADFKVWTFTLRDNVFFHNGEKFTADDVVFTWEWAKENASNSNVKNFYAKTIAEVKALDDTHVEITLASGNIDFLYLYSNEYYSVLNREAVTADAANGPSIGTGPYKNVEFVVSDHTLLERFDQYWGQLPTTKSLLFRYISDGSTRLAALEAGEIDVCQAPNNTELSIIRANEDLGLTTYQAQALTFLAFNQEIPALQDQNLRLAIAYAVNSQEIIDGAASGQGGVANGMWGYFEYGYFDDWASVGQTPYNPVNLEKAKEYMAKSAYPNGLTIKFTAASAWTVNALQIIQAQLKPLNINVEIEQLDAAGFGNLTKEKKHEVVIYSVTFTAAGSDAARIYTPGNSVNYASYNNARVNELFTLAAAETNDATRKAYYKEIQEIVHAECPYIPLYYANSGAAYTKKLSGAVFNNSGKFDYSQVKVEN